MQIVYLSNRPTVLRETWEHVRRHMPFITRALVIAPGDLTGGFGLEDDAAVTFVDESEISGRSGAELAALNHVTRNVTLRRAAVDSGLVEDVFVLSDDDYRPIKPIRREFFTDGERDRSYYFGDLESWTGYGTDFDDAQRITGAVLAYLGAPRLACAVHHPQIMRRDLWIEAFELWDSLRDDNLICEWAWYFNVSRWRHPERFSTNEVYRTLCWPPHLHEFARLYRQPEYQFENFYPEFYEQGRVFEGLPRTVPADDATAARVAVDKLVRWSELGFAVGRLDFANTPDEPWTKGDWKRRVAFRGLWAARKVYDYASLEDRAEANRIHAGDDARDRFTPYEG